ncbi:MAG: protein translocase subunit SecF [Bacillota bacterium]
MFVMTKRKIWYGLSLFFLLVGLVSFAFQGLNKGIDFTSGNVLQVEFEASVSAEEVETVLVEQGLSGYSIQAAGSSSEYLIRSKELTENENKSLLAALTEKLGENEVKRNEKIGEVIGKELTQKAVIALAIASVLMIIYISFRFEMTFGIAAVLALLHDVLVTIGLFSLLQMEIDGAFVAALLTIVGYSINNTIVIFDRVRENMGIMKKVELINIVGISIEQTIFRSISTSLTVIFALVSLLLLGGSSTKVFAFALLVGTVVGTYSSVCIATSLWFDLKTKVTKGFSLRPVKSR